jgi:hypothetical protein
MPRSPFVPAWIAWSLLIGFAALSRPVTGDATPVGLSPAAQSRRAVSGQLFKTSDNCLACHNGLTLASGEDVSIGSSWRATMMANSSRDPYWQASVRRETIDHPAAAAEIEDECAVCHMPMARTQAVAEGRRGRVFAHLPMGRTDSDEARLAADGVSCTLCHQIGAANLGTRESFTGGYLIDLSRPPSDRPVFGPFSVDKGRTRIMHSSTEFIPTESSHIRQSELCATCHTLYTQARGSDGRVAGELPEQVPFLEWRHSAYRNDRSCQSCHMPVVAEATRIASVLGSAREGLARHTFVGGNFFMLRMLNRFRSDLGVEALPAELDAAARATERELESRSAEVSIDAAAFAGGRVQFDVRVRNLTGHKLPTAYPSRRAWLHVTVRDRTGRAIFESGAIAPTGAIGGNDNDGDPLKVEPHFREISRPDDVQIYESVLRDRAGAITTGLLQATGYIKDNRLLPRGFDKRTAEPDIAVHGAASDDPDFSADGDQVRYAIAAAGDGPFHVEAELCYQPIGFRWAQNLERYKSPETERFNAYYDAMATATMHVLARAEVRLPVTGNR